MSRYSVSIGESGAELVYGFDRPLMEYFWQLWADGEVEDCSMYRGERTAGDLLSALAENGVLDDIPAEHRDAIAMDLPF